MSGPTTRNYSGVVLDQSQVPLPGDALDATPDPVYQEFYLPLDYRRGSVDDELRWPALSGFQVLVTVADGYATQASIGWTLDRFDVGSGWQELASGTTIGARADGKTWVDVYLDDPVDVSLSTVGSRYRISVAGRSVPGVVPVSPTVVDYDGTRANVLGQPVTARLRPGIPFPFDLDGVPSFLLYDEVDDQVTFATQWGVEVFWYSSPNPLANLGTGRAFRPEATPVDDGGDVSLAFRLLALVADEGTDFLGSQYRSCVVTSPPANVSPGVDAAYLSDPSPSKFAVKSFFFDLRDASDEATTFDRVLVDVTTPGVYLHVYHSDEGDPATSDDEWNDKLWTPVPGTLQARTRMSFAMPKPVTARYVKVEFSHLQAQPYSPGAFQQPVTYQKHPKWVLEYFMARTETARRQQQGYAARSTALSYDALDLAYNYYLDDLQQEPDGPVTLPDDQVSNVLGFLNRVDDRSDVIDSATLAKINLDLAPWSRDLRFRSRPDYLPNLLTTPGVDAQVGSVTTEVTAEVAPLPYDTPASDPVVLEQDFPVMFFFLECRHRYREVRAKFEEGKAYFVGVRELAFLRDRYTVANDAEQYVESAGDNVNVGRNDFVRTRDGWAVTT